MKSERIWNKFLLLIVEEVKSGGEVKFGSLFKVFKKHKNARKVRNPKTGKLLLYLEEMSLVGKLCQMESLYLMSYKTILYFSRNINF